jgi:hypothetical protein
LKKSERLPSSGKKVGLERSLSAGQRKRIAAFMKVKCTPAEESAFQDGFENTLRLDEEREKESEANYKAQRTRYGKAIRRLDNKITPASRKATNTRNKKLLEAINKHERQFGPADKAELIAWLRSKGLLTRNYVNGRTNELSDRRAYELLTEICSLEGVGPGHKKLR